MKLFAYSETPVQYHIDIYRGLAGSLKSDFHALFRSSGLATRGRDALWGEADVLNDTGLLTGYPNTVLQGASTTEIITTLRRHGARRHDGLLLHTILPSASRRIALVGKALGLRLIFRGSSYYGPYEPRALNWLRSARDRISLLPIDVFCATGTTTWRFFERFGPNKPIVFSPYVVDEYVVQKVGARYGQARRDTRMKLGIREDQLVAIFAGRFSAEKNIFNLLRAYSAYADRPVELLLAGDGPLRDRVLRWVERGRFPRLRPRWLGFLKRRELAEALCASDILVLPSYSEPWGVVVNEALHLQNVCLVSDAVGSRLDLIRDGENGTIVEPYSVASIARGFAAAVEIAARREFVGVNEELNAIFSTSNAIRGILVALSGSPDEYLMRPPGLDRHYEAPGDGVSR
jgi:glycosyltransferase involved in cell wall biosynthesis